MEAVVSTQSTGVQKERLVIPMDNQGQFESERLWINVSEGLIIGDQKLATDEKTKIEEAQRAAVRERNRTGTQWVPKYFTYDAAQKQWFYKWMNVTPFDKTKEAREVECNFRILSVPVGVTIPSPPAPTSTSTAPPTPATTTVTPAASATAAAAPTATGSPLGTAVASQPTASATTPNATTVPANPPPSTAATTPTVADATAPAATAPVLPPAPSVSL
eukprot:TRINITY_DN3481_c0_g2_i1.p1 TRINITY_DN3481_c0_g2~~TRINITY_DN3481_c0_g2_i1.p1  ORF type:complete len:218 (-),score=70.23 TRINITY_DN3481_c0_g2_i1:80-733(-)